MLDAAETLFLEQGFERVSLAAVVRCSGGSLATLYSLFGSKQGLLRAVVSRAIQANFALFRQPMPVDGSAADQLTCIARRFHDHLMQPDTTKLTRIIIAQTLDDPEFGRLFRADVNREIDEIGALFRRWTAEGRARIDEPEEAANLFHAIITSDVQLRALLGASPEDDEAAERQMLWRLAHFIDHFRIS